MKRCFPGPPREKICGFLDDAKIRTDGGLVHIGR